MPSVPKSVRVLVMVSILGLVERGKESLWKG